MPIVTLIFVTERSIVFNYFLGHKMGKKGKSTKSKQDIQHIKEWLKGVENLKPEY